MPMTSSLMLVVMMPLKWPNTTFWMSGWTGRSAKLLEGLRELLVAQLMEAMALPNILQDSRSAVHGLQLLKDDH
eukprot:3284932-Lingulodinium_polyedra.AAC.1